MRLVEGDEVRDWSLAPGDCIVWPNTNKGVRLTEGDISDVLHYFWPYRTNLKGRKAFGVPVEERGIPWWGVREVYENRFKTPLSISFAFVATHNHFVLDRGGKVFKQSAPVIKLLEGAIAEEHLALLGLLNSSVACFWLKQVCHDKASGADKGNRQPDPAKFRYEFAATALQAFPIPPLDDRDRKRLVAFATHLDRLADERLQALPRVLPAVTETSGITIELLRSRIVDAKNREEDILRRQVALQEELDWHVYRLYGLVEDDQALDPEIVVSTSGSPVGTRPFELVQAREGRVLGVDGHSLHAEVPGDTSSSLRMVWESRAQGLASRTPVKLIEHEAYKRRWFVTPKHLAGAVETFEDRLEPCLRDWLLDRLESPRYWPSVELVTTSDLSDKLGQDADFHVVAELYTGRDDYDLTKLVTDLVMSQDVPYLSALRYKPSGLRKRAQWEKTWDLQRKEDAGEDVGKTPVPPKYGSGDFQKSHYWSLRGKLDVPKERFISYPLAERDADPTPVIGWAGWDHLEQARALASFYLERKDQDGWEAERLTPLLAGLLELIPWLKQWHNDIDPEMDVRLGDFYEGFLNEQARSLGLTLQDLRDWRPPAKSGRGRKRG